MVKDTSKAVRNREGRPFKWESVDQVQGLVDDYFKNTPESEWTITGLALALDTYRDVLISYQNKEEFSYTIKRAKEMVHNAYEKDLRKQGRSGDIFALKNFGWTDRQEITGRDGESLAMSTVIINAEVNTLTGEYEERMRKALVEGTEQ